GGRGRPGHGRRRGRRDGRGLGGPLCRLDRGPRDRGGRLARRRGGIRRGGGRRRGEHRRARRGIRRWERRLDPRRGRRGLLTDQRDVGGDGGGDGRGDQE